VGSQSDINRQSLIGQAPLWVVVNLVADFRYFLAESLSLFETSESKAFL
jgi:hypothetical protein